MALTFSTRRPLFWILVPVLLVGAAGAWFVTGHDPHWRGAGVAADMRQDEFEQRLRTYLLDHPEVIVEAMNRLEARQGQQETAEAQAMLKSHTDAIFHDPDSPVGGQPANQEGG